MKVHHLFLNYLGGAWIHQSCNPPKNCPTPTPLDAHKKKIGKARQAKKNAPHKEKIILIFQAGEHLLPPPPYGRLRFTL